MLFAGSLLDRLWCVALWITWQLAAAWHYGLMIQYFPIIPTVIIKEIMTLLKPGTRTQVGDLSIQGNIKSVYSLVEPLQIAMENGARRALIPLENKRNFLEVSGEIIEKVDPVFYSDPQSACTKALGGL